MTSTATPYEPLGSLLRAARVRKCLEQKTLAAALDVTPRALREWEKGHSRPTLRRIPAIAVELELDAAELAELADVLEGARTEDSHEGNAGTHR